MTAGDPKAVAGLASSLPNDVIEAALKALDANGLQALKAALIKAEAADKAKSPTLRAKKFTTRQEFMTLKKVIDSLKEKIDEVFINVGENKKKLGQLQKLVAAGGGGGHRVSSRPADAPASPSSPASPTSPKDTKSGTPSVAKSKARTAHIPKAGARTAGGDPDHLQERKISYRFGNRKINVIKPSVEVSDEDKRAKPKCELQLDFAYGYQGCDSHSRQNVYLSKDRTKLVYYLAGVCIVHELTTGKQRFFTEHNEDVTCIDLHPTRTLVASGQVDPKGPEKPCVAIWDYNNPEESVAIIEDAHDWEVLKVQFSPNNNYLYSIGGDDDHTLKIWDMDAVMEQGEKGVEPLCRPLPTSKEELFGLVINPYSNSSDTKGGQLIDEFVTYGRKSAKFWWVRSDGKDKKGKPKFSIRGRQIVMGEFAPPAASAKMSSKKARSRGPAKKKTKKLPGGEACFHFCEFHPSGQYILGGHSGHMYVGKESAVVGKVMACKEKEPCGEAAILDNGDIVTFGLRGTVRRYKLNGVKFTQMSDVECLIPGLQAHSAPAPMGARASAWDADRGILYVGTKTNEIVKLDMKKADEGGQLLCPPVIAGQEGDIWACTCHPKKNIFITGGHDRALKVWDAKSNELIDYFEFENPGDLIECASFNNSGNMLAVGLANSKVVLFTFEPTFEMVHVEEVPKKKKTSETLEVLAVRFSPDDTKLGICHDEMAAFIFDIEMEPKVNLKRWTHCHMDHSAAPTHIRWSENGDRLSTFTRDYEIMNWILDHDKKTAKHDNYSEDPDKVKKAGDPLIAGYDVMGCYQSNLGWDGTDLNFVSCAKTKPLCVSGDDFGTVRVHNYPCLEQEANYAYGGHSAFVVGGGFTADDNNVITIGGGDKAIFKWKVA